MDQNLNQGVILSNTSLTDDDIKIIAQSVAKI